MHLFSPPVFHNWFYQIGMNRQGSSETLTFSSIASNPAKWYKRKLSFSCSTAVQSIIGYIMGLGDRHCENLLLDKISGEIVHVDFSCLFDKGRELEVPECVPFRLTHNMVDALGVTGIEGSFRISCTETMKIVRENKKTILSVLETFLYDPLVEWIQGHTKEIMQPVLQDLHTNSDAKEKLKHVEARLNGILDPYVFKVRPVNRDEPSTYSEIDQNNMNVYGPKSSLPLSVDGHVSCLIEAATSVKHLSRMYIWWMPWL